MISRNIIGSGLEREGHDRSDINLPGNQLQLLKDVSTVANCMLKTQQVQLLLYCSNYYTYL